MNSIPPLSDLLKPTRLKLRVLSLAIASFALFELIEVSPFWVAVLSSALIGYALSPLSVKRETVYSVEYVTQHVPDRKPSELPEKKVLTREQQVVEVARLLYSNNKKVMSRQTAEQIATRIVDDGKYAEIVTPADGKMLVA